MKYSDVEILVKFAASLDAFSLYEFEGKLYANGMFQFAGYHKDQVKQFITEFNNRIAAVVAEFRSDMERRIIDAVLTDQ
jgi:hypothetical protein